MNARQKLKNQISFVCHIFHETHHHYLSHLTNIIGNIICVDVFDIIDDSLLPPKRFDLKFTDKIGRLGQKCNEAWKIQDILFDIGRLKTKCHVHHHDGVKIKTFLNKKKKEEKSSESFTELTPSVQ